MKNLVISLLVLLTLSFGCKEKNSKNDPKVPTTAVSTTTAAVASKTTSKLQIYPYRFTVVSDGRSGRELVRDLEKKQFSVNGLKQMLQSSDFEQGQGVRYELVVVPVKQFPVDKRTTENISAVAKSQGYSRPPAFIAARLREQLSNSQIKNMGFSHLLVMHEPVVGLDGKPLLLAVSVCGDHRFCEDIGINRASPQQSWGSDEGFVFLYEKRTITLSLKTSIFEFTVTSDGRDGEKFIRSLEGKGFKINDEAKSMLRNKAFSSTKGVVYKLGIIRVDNPPDDDFSDNLSVEVTSRGWSTPPAEVAPLLREKISDEQIAAMGLHDLVVEHDYIDHGIYNDWLALCRHEKRLLGAWSSHTAGTWRDGLGFVFLISQK
ncbi:MAG: hypothetical protein M3M85_01350 [bacterium]|nr:hypothetical protein [bacterium]